MKKLIILGAMCIAILIATSPSAHADEKVCGTATVNWILVFESDCETDVPVHPCIAEINIHTQAGQDYVLPVKACGTLINYALLKAFNWQEEISICLWINLYPFEAWVGKVDFGERTLGDHGKGHCKGDNHANGHNGWASCVPE